MFLESCDLRWHKADLANSSYSGVGKALPGSKIKICAPVTQEVLNKNEVGELHIGGTSVINGYLDGVEQDSFYKDEHGIWLKTGDQACIDDNDVLRILGRYKDLIIRGGENISPAKIEQCLEKIPGLFVSIFASISKARLITYLNRRKLSDLPIRWLERFQLP